ncbi:hypothetical protein D3C76_1880600 [compost metagenome]
MPWVFSHLSAALILVFFQALSFIRWTAVGPNSSGFPYGAITDKWVYGCLLPDNVHVELKARRRKS